jgi:gliding motility-associated-like protein
MIESSVGGEGSFKICIEDFIPVPSPESDCRDGVILCDKSPFIVQNLTGNGSVVNEIEPGNCINSEFASSWYKWTCDQSGTLEFTLTPNNNEATITDDLDFAVYELPNGIDDCSGKILLRCMASGANTQANGQPSPLSDWVGCNGPTGLRNGESDVQETAGCAQGDNNFISPLDMESGKSYVLIVNNFSRSGLGFGIDFGGTGTFLGPLADFEITSVDAFECDKTIVFTNLSTSSTDSIVNTYWNFGDGANPLQGNGVGPYSVVYESFGDKIAAITVESSKGCTVTKILDFYVEACCQDTSTLSLNGLIKDLDCYEIPTGSILLEGISGAPQYKYSIEGEEFTPIPLYTDLDIGNYDITIQDIKGCEFSRSFTVNQPPPLEVDPGEDESVKLGCPFNFDASIVSSKPLDTLYWSPPAGIEDINSLDSEVFPPNDIEYTLTIIDTSGCIQSARMSATVEIDRVIIAPNIFSPNGDGINENFFISIGQNDNDPNCKPPVEYIDRFMIFDRWGSLVYDEQNIFVDNRTTGWDGRKEGKKVSQGVYTWVALVKFIDQVSPIEYHGDITVVR